MAKNPVVAKLIYNKLPQLQGQLRQRASQAVRDAAFDVEAHAKTRARVDTGAMKSSFYVVTNDKSTYNAAVSAMREANPNAEVLPPAEATRKDLEAVVASAAAHTVYNEFGTAHMPPQPMLLPAAEAVRPGFVAAMKQLLS
ncbi:MAG: HK97 gp10 family phage protein [Chloroflexi bacterium]|nr:HK97 gp10 family phage protein [Chloroflexota bacterium]